jgi:nitronate monooxygenase
VSVLPESRIVLAPLAGGPSSPELAAAVANAGGLPFLGAGYLTPDALGEDLDRTRALTDAPLGVNIFVLRELPVDDVAVAAYAEELRPEALRRGVQLGVPRFDDDWFDAKLALVLDAGAAVVSFTFGCPSDAALDRVRTRGAEVWLTVTSVGEAQQAVAAGADALVVQGAEAGGHRGTWDDTGSGDLPLLELMPAIAAVVDLPLVATGGIADRDGVLVAVEAGAAAAQIGTAFLLCPEAGTSEPHRRAVAAGGETAITRAFTGRRARGIVNAFMRRHPNAPSAYPQIHHVTAPLRAAARAAGDTDGFNLWAGTNLGLARTEPAAEIVARLRP